MLKAIAIDDEPIALEVVKSFAEKVLFLEVKSYFTDSFEALDYMQQQPIDLLFLDIKMPDVSGIDFLRSLPNPPMVIFTTAYSQHAVESFELDAIDYLLKPFSLARFLKACNKAQEQLVLRQNTNSTTNLPSIFIKSGYEKVRINLADLLYIESTGNYMKFVFSDQQILSRMTMQEVNDLFPKNIFIRIHRSFIVAIKNISKMDKKYIWIDDRALPIGKQYIADVERLT